MDEIAERGLAAHWKYKGIKSENGLDDWMNNVREVLEAAGNGGALELMRDFKMDLYDKEVFVFTPKGDLYKLPLGATLLDFAFLIHTGLGGKCVGGKVNGKIETIKYKLKSGDTIEVLTSPNQTPKQDWLNIAATSKGRVKIKQALNEQQNKAAEYGKELLQRRFKNRKIDPFESVRSRQISSSPDWICSTAAATWAYSISPSGVSSTPFLERTNSVQLSSLSRFFIVRETLGWLFISASAACEMLPYFAT